jgi:hypothetical protein
MALVKHVILERLPQWASVKRSEAEDHVNNILDGLVGLVLG